MIGEVVGLDSGVGDLMVGGLDRRIGKDRIRLVRGLGKRRNWLGSSLIS